MRAGDSLLLPKPGQTVAHLWVLLTDPDAATDEVLMVNLTTQRPHSDTTVVLKPGDHPFVTHPTVVNFSDARLVKATVMQDYLSRGVYMRQAALSSAVLQRLQAGLLASPFTPNKFKDCFRQRPAAQRTAS
jgi:hypothetical protein